MPDYNTPGYSDRIQTPTPGHQPIYGQVPLNPVVNLTTQVAPPDLLNPATTPQPVLIATASKSGAILESMLVVSVAPVLAGGGYGGGGTTLDWGLGTAADPVFLYFYTRREQDPNVYFLARLNLFQLSAADRGQSFTARFGFLILPKDETAWRLEPSQEVYVALSKPVRAPGVNVFLHGMHYS